MATASKSASAWSVITAPDTVRRAIYVLGLAPAAWVFYRGFTDQLGADPVRTLERTLGLWSLRFLIIGLAITPLRRLGGSNLIRYRRAIGLVAFAYAFLHLVAYVWFDQGFDLAAIWKDIVKRWYITVGMAAFALLVLLAVTSNNQMIKRLGGAAWQRLHRLVYAAAALAAIHFLLLVKTWKTTSPDPLVYAVLVAALLLFRLVVYLRKRAARAGKAVTA